MHKITDGFFRLLEILVVACMVAMVVMVFGNVVLRYVFNSGIDISDELSRYCFIWLTYVGAMVAMREGGHLGMDSVVKLLPLAGKKTCLFISESVMLACNAMFFYGTLQMHDLQVSNVSPVLGMSMIWVYGIGYVVAVVMGLLNLHTLYRLMSGRIEERELVQVQEEGASEDAEAAKEVTDARQAKA